MNFIDFPAIYKSWNCFIFEFRWLSSDLQVLKWLDFFEFHWHSSDIASIQTLTFHVFYQRYPESADFWMTPNFSYGRGQKLTRTKSAKWRGFRDVVWKILLALVLALRMSAERTLFCCVGLLFDFRFVWILRKFCWILTKFWENAAPKARPCAKIAKGKTGKFAVFRERGSTVCGGAAPGPPPGGPWAPKPLPGGITVILREAGPSFLDFCLPTRVLLRCFNFYFVKNRLLPSDFFLFFSIFSFVFSQKSHNSSTCRRKLLHQSSLSKRFF